MLVLGLILWILGTLLDVSVLSTIGIVVAIIGGVLLLLGLAGTRLGGRRYWY